MKVIKVSPELHEFLTKQAISKGETYDQIIKRLIKKLWNTEVKVLFGKVHSSLLRVPKEVYNASK